MGTTTIEEKIEIAKKGAGGSDHDKIFFGMDSLPKGNKTRDETAKKD